MEVNPFWYFETYYIVIKQEIPCETLQCTKYSGIVVMLCQTKTITKGATI